MNTNALRRTVAAGLAVAAIISTAGCSRHLGAQPDPAQNGQPAASTTVAPTAGDGTGSGSAAAATATPGQPAGAAQAAAQATAALGTAIDRAGAAASTQTSDLSASAGGSEGDPTQ